MYDSKRKPHTHLHDRQGKNSLSHAAPPRPYLHLRGGPWQLHMPSVDADISSRLHLGPDVDVGVLPAAHLQDRQARHEAGELGLQLLHFGDQTGPDFSDGDGGGESDGGRCAAGKMTKSCCAKSWLDRCDCTCQVAVH